MNATVHRHFVTLPGGRQVHYHRAGRGPALLLLHQSPQSSREMRPLLAAWGTRHTAIAPDMPGYGLSDPLATADATLDDFADALEAFIAALGLGRVATYGYHTGASLGLRHAMRHPQRVTALALNGLVMPTPDELGPILRDYLPPITPQWDGSHLAWLWARLREQTVFFPWHRRSAATRMHFDMPPPERLQQSLNEFLAAGAHYAVAYRAAFAGHAERTLSGLTVPTRVTAAARDPLAAHLARIHHPSPCVEVAPSTDPADALARCQAWLDDHPGDEAPAAPPTGPAAPQAIVEVGGLAVRLSRSGNDDAPTCLLVHGAGAAGRQLAAHAAALAATHRVVVPDLPGHGGSDAPEGDVLEACASALQAVLGTRHGQRTRLIGHGSGAALLALLAERGLTPPPAAAIEPLPLPAGERAAWLDEGLPSLTPVWHGGHLLEAWHMVRDARLWQPWFRRDSAHIIRGEPALDVDGLHVAACDILRASGTWQALLRRILEESPEPGH